MLGRTFLLIALCCTELHVCAADWPQFLGLNGNYTSPESIRTNWSEQAPTELWRKPIGQGFSGMAVVGGRVFTLVRRSIAGTDREVCVALDTQTGNELWATDVDLADYSDLSGYGNAMDGPRSTPTIDADRAYVFTGQLKLLCLRCGRRGGDLATGFSSGMGSDVISWQNAASPLLVGELIFVNANASRRRLMAVRKADGKTVWSGQDDGMTHATPVFARIADTPQVIFLTRSGLVAVAPDNGSLLWRLGFSPSTTSTAASPVVAGDWVYASAAYGSGTWVAHVVPGGGGWVASLAWRQQGNAYQSHWSTPVPHDGFLYCVATPSSSLARLTCLDLQAGTNRWTQSVVGSKSIGFGSVIRCANALIVLTEDGELVLAEPSPEAYREVGRFKVLTRYCWNHASLSDGRIYARSTSATPQIVALDVAPVVSPLPQLALGLERAEGTGVLRLSIRAADGTSLDATQSSRVELLSSTNTALPLAEWPLSSPWFAFTNGLWVTDIPLASEPAQFLRVREKTQ